MGKKCSFLGKFGMLSFLVTPVLRFALSPYYRRIVNARRAVVFLFVFPVEQICFLDFVIKSFLKAAVVFLLGTAWKRACGLL